MVWAKTERELNPSGDQGPGDWGSLLYFVVQPAGRGTSLAAVLAVQSV